VVLVLAVLVSVAQAVENVPAVESKTSGMMDYAGDLCDRLNEVWVYRCGVFAAVGGLFLLIPIYMNTLYEVDTDVNITYPALLVLFGSIFAGVNGYFMGVQSALIYVILYSVVCVKKVREIIAAIYQEIETDYVDEGPLYYGACPLFLSYYALGINNETKGDLGNGLYVVPFPSAIGASVWVWAIYGIWRLLYFIYTLTPLYKEEVPSVEIPADEQVSAQDALENIAGQLEKGQIEERKLEKRQSEERQPEKRQVEERQPEERQPEKKPRILKPVLAKEDSESGSAMQTHLGVNLSVGLLAAALATLCM